MNEKDHSPLGNSNITIYNQKKSFFITDVDGFFSIKVYKADTVIFSHIGYKSKTAIIPTSTSFKNYTYIVLSTDTTILKGVTIYPWPTISEFKKEFLSLKIQDKDYETAKKNLDLMTYEALTSSEYDPKYFDNKDYLIKQNIKKIQYKGQIPPDQVIRFLAPLRLIIALKEKELNQKNYLDYKTK